MPRFSNPYSFLSPGAPEVYIYVVDQQKARTVTGTHTQHAGPDSAWSWPYLILDETGGLTFLSS